MDGGDRLVEIRVLPGIDRIAADDWDACAAPESGPHCSRMARLK